MVTENTAPNAAADVEMSQYVADRTRVNEDKIKQDDEIISQFGDYSYGWHDSDAAGEAAKRGIDENVVRGFVEPISRELPMEYALELNRLVELQMEGSVG